MKGRFEEKGSKSKEQFPGLASAVKLGGEKDEALTVTKRGG